MPAMIGRALVILVAALLLVDGLLQLASAPMLVHALTEIGFAPDAVRTIGLVTLSCALLLAIPRTRLPGAVLTTGFLGGAICAHLRVGEVGSPPQLVCLVLGAAMWTGLLVADHGLRALFDRRPTE